MHSSTEVSMRDGWREEKKQGWEWDGEGIEGEQKCLENKQRDIHKTILTIFSRFIKSPKQTIKDDHAT